MISIAVEKDGKELLVNFDYSKDKVEKIRTIKQGRWDKENKVWRIPNNDNNLIKLEELFGNEEIKYRGDNELLEEVSQLIVKRLIRYI